jgi:hypothetical protein
VQLDPPIRVVVCGREQLVADLDVHIELLPKLARQPPGKPFARVAFAARKLPVAGEVYAVLTPRDQKAAALLDDRGRHDDRRHVPGFRVNGNVRQPLDIGQAGHLGLRATHTVAPRSMRAWLKSKTCRDGTSISDIVHR